MANSFTTQVTLDGPRNAVVKIDGVLDTSNLGSTTVFDPAVQYIDLLSPTTQVRIDYIWYSVQAPLSLQFLWDATTPVRIVDLSGASYSALAAVGGYQNNAGAGKNGKILCLTNGWAAGTVTFTAVLELVKQ